MSLISARVWNFLTIHTTSRPVVCSSLDERERSRESSREAMRIARRSCCSRLSRLSFPFNYYYKYTTDSPFMLFSRSTFFFFISRVFRLFRVFPRARKKNIRFFLATFHSSFVSRGFSCASSCCCFHFYLLTLPRLYNNLF